MSVPRRIVIVGDGLAGASAARTLREQGFDGRVVLVGNEDHPPYERPPLSKEYLRGETDKPRAYVEPESYWAEHDVELRTGAAARIDLAGGRLELASGEHLGFDRLLLAPGAAPRTLPVPGGDLDGVLTLRRFADADAIRARTGEANRVLVVGGGWIGSEVAASLRTLGHDVTLVLRGLRPLEHALGPEIGEVYGGLHAEHGVTVLSGTEIETFDGDGAVRRARTTSAGWLDTDLVVLAVGVTPRVELARAAGLTVTDGIAVDGRLATSDPRVLAAGDVALVPSGQLRRSVRVEHWGAALAQGAHAARAMLGATEPYDELPYYFSDQYETGMEFWGDPALPGELVVRGDLGSRSFTAFWQDAGRVRAVLNMHVHHHHDHDHEEHHHEHAGGHIDPAAVQRLIRATIPADAAALRDPDVPLETLPA